MWVQNWEERENYEDGKLKIEMIRLEGKVLRLKKMNKGHIEDDIGDIIK